MSVTVKNSASASQASLIRPDRRGHWWPLLLKEIRATAPLFGIFLLVILIAKELARRAWIGQIETSSVPVLLTVIQIMGLLYPLIVGARTFAREFERGIWESFRSARVSAWELWSSKLVVTSISTLIIVALGEVSFSACLGRQVTVEAFTLRSVLEASIALLVLSISAQCSLLSREVWLAMLLSPVLSLPPAYFVIRLAASSPRFTRSTFALVLSSLILMWSAQLWQVRRKLDAPGKAFDARRWGTAFLRLAWKETLAARGFWLAVIGIAVMLDAAALLSFKQTATRDLMILTVGTLLPLLHSLGCGAIAFSIEREDQTSGWLRNIAVPTSAVFAAKLLVSQVSVLSLTGVVLSGTQLLVSPAERWNVFGCAALFLAATLNACVGIGASLLTRRVPPAVFVAFIASLTLDVLLLVITDEPGRGTLKDLVPELLPWWVLAGTTLVTMEFWLSERWLQERRWWPERWYDGSSKLLPPSPSEHVEFTERSSSPIAKSFHRLLWREWMESRGWWWALPLALAPWLMNTFSNSLGNSEPDKLYWAAMVALGISSMLLTTLPTLCGVWAFHHDQRQELFRFLSDRGGSPTAIWLSKHVVWLPFVLALATLAGASIGRGVPGPQVERLLLVGFAILGALQSYAAGQLCSQLIRSSLIAMFLGSVLSLLLGFWSAVLWQVRAPWPFQLTAAAILFVASWVHSRDWLRECWSRLTWLRIGMAILIPSIMVLLILESFGYPVCQTIRDLTLGNQ